MDTSFCAVQVGETGREERQTWLREKYFFTCACTACMSITKSDLLLFAFRCSRIGCNGVVPGSEVVQTASDVINATSLVSQRKRVLTNVRQALGQISLMN
jgi:hypothetical protein